MLGFWYWGNVLIHQNEWLCCEWINTVEEGREYARVWVGPKEVEPCEHSLMCIMYGGYWVGYN